MANSKKGGKPTSQTGAIALILLVQNYKSQMIALLLKNGVVVPQGASNRSIAMLMANLLKISKSYANDLNAFVSNPKVIEVIGGAMEQTAQYFRMSGRGYLNNTGQIYDFNYDVPDYANYDSDMGLDFGSNTTTTSTTPATSNSSTNSTANTPKNTGSGDSWWTGVKQNYASWISQGLNLFGTISTNQANVDIANAQSTIAQANAGSTSSDDTSSNDKKKKDDEGMSTTTIVVLSLVGVALIGTVIYFVTRPKE